MFDGELPPEILRKYPTSQLDKPCCAWFFYGWLWVCVFVIFPGLFLLTAVSFIYHTIF